MSGRPSSFTPEIGQTICTRIAQGETLTAICRDPEMPARSTVGNWLTHPDPSEEMRAFMDSYVRAREAAAEGEFEEIREIADGAEGGAVAVADEAIGEMDANTRQARKVYRQRYYESLNAAKLRIDARKFRVARMNASKYGDKAQVQLSSPPGQPVRVEHTATAHDLAKVLAVLAEAGVLPLPEAEE